MILSLIAIAVTAGIAYIWVLRGFFSALINMVCVLIAGAIAFAVFEPLAYTILQKMGVTGLQGSIWNSAWALGLGLPFAASLALLRVIADKCLPNNVGVSNAVNYVGGGVCGAVSGVVSAGILIMSIGFLRVDTEFMGYRPLQHGSDSSIVRTQNLIVPVDKLTAMLYNHASTTALSVDEPLAKWYPAFYEVPHATRMNQGDGTARNTIKTNDFSVINRYTVGGEKTPLSALLADQWNTKTQGVQDLGGQPYPSNSRLEGFVVEFSAGAKEKNQQVVLGPAQVRLVSENADGTEHIAAHPIAVVTRAQTAKINYARFRYDSRDLFMASVAGDASPKMGFEFVVPQGFTPIALYIKNTRWDASSSPIKPEVYAATAERDNAIKDGKLVKASVDAPEVAVVRAGGERDRREEGVEVRNTLPYNRVIQDGTQRDLEVNTPMVVSGKTVFRPNELENRGIDKALRIDRFDVPKGAALVQCEMNRESKVSIFGKGVEMAEATLTPLLMSVDGQTFEAVGYWYEDSEKVVVRYTPDNPIRAMQNLIDDGVSITQSRSDQKLTLLFTVGVGVDLSSMNLGQKEIHKFAKPIKVEAPGR